MEIQNIFYAIGIFFLFVTVVYFLMTYLEDVPANIKVALSFILSVILFVLGDYMRGADK